MDNRLPPNSDNFQRVPYDNQSPPNQLNTETRPASEPKDRKLQKADREKLRRGRLNEQFTELGKTLDPERPKFDKATILGDTIQMLNDLTAQVSRLKSEYTTLTEESRELTQEKHDLREEKASLKSEIENLTLQYQQRVNTMYPYPHSYPYPVPMQMQMQMPPVPAGTMPMHPFPFFQSPVQYVSPAVQGSSRSHVSGKQESGSGKHEDSNDVATELQLKTPGSTAEQDGSAGESKSKSKSKKLDSSISDESGCSSSGTVQASSSNSVINPDR